MNVAGRISPCADGRLRCPFVMYKNQLHIRLLKNRGTCPSDLGSLFSGREDRCPKLSYRRRSIPAPFLFCRIFQNRPSLKKPDRNTGFDSERKKEGADAELSVKTGSEAERASSDDAPGGPQTLLPDAALMLPTLGKNDFGETVRAAQLLLIGRGFSCGRCGADGDFGPDTRRAALRCQRRNGLEPDGVIGPLTWAALLGVSA